MPDSRLKPNKLIWSSDLSSFVPNPLFPLPQAAGSLPTAPLDSSALVLFPVRHDRNDVMLNPMVFHQMRKALHFKPSVDLFASADHHQVPR